MTQPDHLTKLFKCALLLCLTGSTSFQTKWGRWRGGPWYRLRRGRYLTTTQRTHKVGEIPTQRTY